MSLENYPMFTAINDKEVKPPKPPCVPPLTSQESHFAIMQRVNMCIDEVGRFEERVRREMESFMISAGTENTAFKEAIQTSYNAFMQTVQREINSFKETTLADIAMHWGEIDTAFARIQADYEALKVTLNNGYMDFKAEVNNIVNVFKQQVNERMDAQDGKIEEYKNFMVDNLTASVKTVFDQKAQNGEVTAIMREVYGDGQTFKGSLSYDEIQAVTNANNGDYYYCTTDEHYYKRTENAWVDIGSGDKIVNDYEAFKTLARNAFENMRNVDVNTLYEAVAKMGVYGVASPIDLSMSPGYLNGDDRVDGSSNPILAHSDFVTVVPHEVLYLTTDPSVQYGIKFYDKDKVRISSHITGNIVRFEKVIVPANAYYARVNKCSDNVVTSLYRSNVTGDNENVRNLLANIYSILDTFIERYTDKTSDYELQNNAFIHKDNGNVVEYNGIADVTDFLSVENLDVYVRSYADLQACSIAFYDENKVFIKSDGVDNNSWVYRHVNLAYIMETCPNAKYVRFSSLYTHLMLSDAVRGSLYHKLRDISNNLLFPNSYVDVTNTLNVSNLYVDKWSGRDNNAEIAFTTDYIELNNESAFAVTGVAEYSTCIVAMYDANKRFVKPYGCNDSKNGNDDSYPERTVFNREIFTKERIDNIANTNIRYVRFSSYGSPLTVEAITFVTANQKVKELNENVNLLNQNVNNLLVNSNNFPWTGKTWVAFGDSLTENNDSCEKTYHDNIHDQMGITVLNHGTSGSGYMNDGNEAWHIRINDVANLDFDVITFFGSGNDLGHAMGTATDTGVDTLGGAINTTLDNLFKIKPLAKVGLITPTPWSNNMPYNNNRMKTYADLIVEIARNRGIPCLDLFRCSTLDPNKNEHLNAFFYNADGCHPNDAGHARITPQIREFLRTLL